ncbi:GNAT family N-acetyltransferase [Thiobacillus sp.]|uniref:GNAT family N-acetyltransferase n=1 Tax=Thiobacillus sp. TaxID=924 RepID=UPI00286DC2DE|nr:GNAT family N-acetyltransferase [Thiobacillus sp.]
MITIRQCIKTDLLSCSALLQEIYAGPPYEESWPESRATEYLESFFRIDAEGALVATENEDKIVGAVFGFSYPWQVGSIFFIQELFVAGQYRGKGIAGDLVRQVVEKKGGDSHVALIVREGTVAAKFYEKLGLSKSTLYELRSGKLRV